MGIARWLLEGFSGIGCPRRRHGSVLVMVLWVMVLVAFLAAQHGAHNRDKASLAVDTMGRIAREQAVQSIVDLYRGGKPVFATEKDVTWRVISINDRDVWVRYDEEGKRVRVDPGNEVKLRELVRTIQEQRYPDRSEREIVLQADELTDAMLDWIDADDLVRLNGAEADVYIQNGLSYVPSDAPFRTMTEMLLVIGMSEAFFWGDPLARLLEDLARMADMAGLRWEGGEDVASSRLRTSGSSRMGTETLEWIRDFWDAVTIYDKNVHRLTMIGLEPQGGYWMAVVFLKSGGAGGGAVKEILEEIRLRFPSDTSERQIASVQEAGRGLRNPLWKRYTVVEP
uniref:T2SS protein K first SAM-like domain-containing protein n=1 Tax=Desulfatirhabdium butyrativorans TaxID=340467 RepID=A0A7C4VRE3_9BACT